MEFLIYLALAASVSLVLIITYGVRHLLMDWRYNLEDQLESWWFSLRDWVDGLGHYIYRRYVYWMALRIAPHILIWRKKAREAGKRIGYQRGYEDGKVVWEILDTRTIPAEREIDDSVYGPELFKVTDALCNQMRREVESAVELKLVRRPTPEQWKMILSSHPSTCVLAGAGSGKSTTLVLRIIFMAVHLGIKLEEMTVVSFTNDSCNDLREKLIALAPHWELPIDSSVAKDIVRTFHSALYRMGKNVFPGVNWFENIGRKKDHENDVDNPFASSINEDQVDLLKSTYFSLFEGDKIFRNAVLEMLEIEFKRVAEIGGADNKAYSEGIIRLASRRDRELVDLVNARWQQHGLLPIDGVDATPFEIFRVDGHPFYANGKIASSGVPIFLGGGTQENGWFTKNETLSEGNDKFPVIGAIGVKRNIVSWRFGKTSIYLGSKSAIDIFSLRIRHLNPQNTGIAAPMFDVGLGGEKVRVGLLEAFVSQASFIESMGLEVTDFVSRKRAFKSADINHHFCTALARYWPRLEQDLWAQKIMTFNRGFRSLSHALTDQQRSLSLELHCYPLKHLLIDEFQDISPQIVSWVKNAQQLLATKDKKPSIMAIGDDWQSIYGWRGSSPEFFIQFDRYFKVHPELVKANRCPMGENFRSIPDIVKDGAEVLDQVTIKVPKPVHSKVPKESGDHGVKLMLQGEKTDESYCKDIANVINEQYEQMIKRSGGDKKKVLVIGRTNAIVDAIENCVGKKPGVSYRTIHRSKGLQAEVAVICEDCTSEDEHPIRDRVYALMDGFQCKSYTDAQRDEALRLAYVAITRGIRRVHWFAGKGNGAAKALSSTALRGATTLVTEAKVQSKSSIS